MIHTMLAVVIVLTMSCGGSNKGPNNSDVVGGKEALTDSMSCSGLVPSLDSAGKPDKVRGFEIKVIAFVYSEGSSAASLITKYAFNADGASFEETVSRVWPQNETKNHLQTELLLVKLDLKGKSAEVYKKYALGAESFGLDCK